MSDQKTTIADLKELIIKFRDERNWQQFHTPRALAMSIVLEASELLEHFQWDTADFSRESLLKNEEKLSEMKKELADIVVYALTFAHTLDIDVSEAVKTKMEHNAKKYPVEHFNKDKQDLEYYKKVKSLYRSGKTNK